jgi:hypothetical protein
MLKQTKHLAVHYKQRIRYLLWNWIVLWIWNQRNNLIWSCFCRKVSIIRSAYSTQLIILKSTISVLKLLNVNVDFLNIYNFLAVNFWLFISFFKSLIVLHLGEIHVDCWLFKGFAASLYALKPSVVFGRLNLRNMRT